MKPEHSQLRDYVRVLWRRKWIVVLVAVLAPLAAVVISLLQPAVYESSAEVLLRSENITGALTGGGNPARVAETQRFLSDHPGWGMPAVPEATSALERLAVPGAVLEPLELFAVGTVLASARALARDLEDDPGRYPSLVAVRAPMRCGTRSLA